jgi:O-antigen/teichoic acid export membrane protein
VVRGSAIRAAGYGAGLVIGVAVSILLLRYLGVVDFGRYVTVVALLGIVSAIADGGLTAVGARELAVRPDPADRERLLANLVGLRLVITPLGVAAAVGFALVAGYDRDLVVGALLAGIGLMLVILQTTAMLPLTAELRLGRVTVVEVLRHVVTLAGVAALVAAGAAFLTFFAVQILVGVAVLAVTPPLLRGVTRLGIAFDRDVQRTLVREALPLAAALAMNVVYFRVLVVQMSLMAPERETGYFATSFRIFEVLLALPVLVLSVALPVLSVAAGQDPARMRNAVQRLTEVALLAAVPLVLGLAIAAEPILRVLGGEEFTDAAPVLTVQALSLLALFLGQAWQLALVAIRRQGAVAAANGIALVAAVGLGLATIPRWEAIGAAWSAVIAETLLAAVLLGALAATRRDLVPQPRFAWRVALAAAPAVAVAFIPGLPAAAAAVLAVAVFGAVAVLARAVPPEVLRALPFRPRGG